MALLLKSVGFIITMFGLLVTLGLLLIAGFLFLAPHTLPDLRVADGSVARSLVFTAVAFTFFLVGAVMYAIGNKSKPSSK